MRAVSVDLGSYCNSQTENWSLDGAWLNDDLEVEIKYPTVYSNFYSAPGLTIQAIRSFQNDTVTEEYLTDQIEMNSALLKILNSIIQETRKTFESQLEGAKNWSAAMRKSFIPAVYAAAAPDLVWGSELKRDIAIRMNRDSTVNLRVAFADMSDAHIKMGKQVAALSKDVISAKLNKSEEVLIIKRLDTVIPQQGNFNSKNEAVMHFFSRDGTCPLLLIKEMYALSLVNRLVYIRFWTKDAKFKAEAKIKAFKAQNPDINSRHNVLT